MRIIPAPSRQFIMAEYMKCKRDAAYFINTYIKIKDSQTGQTFPFKLWDFQEEYVNSFKSPSNPDGHRFHLVLKSRQLGMSTTTLALLLHKAMFQRHAKIVLACKKLDDSSKMLTDELYFMLDNLPDWLKPKHTKNKTRVTFLASNSWVQAIPASPEALRQYQATHAVFDEFAFYNSVQKGLDEKMYAAALPSFQRSGFCTIISTPNGMGNMYAEYCLAARAGTLPNWWYKEMSWRLREERLHTSEGVFDNGLEFMQSILSQPNGKRIWAAEYDCNFLQSGASVFNAESIFISTKVEEPISGEQYVVGADVAGGDPTGDYLVAQVLKVSTGEQVFTYRGHMSPKSFGTFLNNLGRKYNNALMGVERNNMGISSIDELERLKYPNMYRHIDNKIGFLTSSVTKPEIIFDLDAALNNGLIHLSDRTTADELLIFEHKASLTSSGGMGAPNGKNDDTVIALSIAFHLMNKHSRPRTTKTRKQAAKAGW